MELYIGLGIYTLAAILVGYKIIRDDRSFAETGRGLILLGVVSIFFPLTLILYYLFSEE